jgi:hypothetical protein
VDFTVGMTTIYHSKVCPSRYRKVKSSILKYIRVLERAQSFILKCVVGKGIMNYVYVLPGVDIIFKFVPVSAGLMY